MTLVFETAVLICILPYLLNVRIKSLSHSHLICWVLGIHSSILSPAPEVAKIIFFQIEFCMYLVWWHYFLISDLMQFYEFHPLILCKIIFIDSYLCCMLHFHKIFFNCIFLFWKFYIWTCFHSSCQEGSKRRYDWKGLKLWRKDTCPHFPFCKSLIGSTVSRLVMQVTNTLDLWIWSFPWSGVNKYCLEKNTQTTPLWYIYHLLDILVPSFHQTVRLNWKSILALILARQCISLMLINSVTPHVLS